MSENDNPQSPRPDDHSKKEPEKQKEPPEELPPAKEAHSDSSDRQISTANLDHYAIPKFFADVILNDAHPWAKIAGYCSNALSSDIAINAISLEYLASEGLCIGPDIIRNRLYDAISKHRAIGLQVPDDIDGETGQVVAKGLRGVSIAYLCMVRLSTIKLLCLPDPIVSESKFYRIFAALQPGIHVDRYHLDDVVQSTTWDPRFGYRFWHEWHIPGRDYITWFHDSATRHILWHAIKNSAGELFITPQELGLHPAHQGDIMLFNAGASHVVNKISFVLAWLVVQMRMLVETHRDNYRLGSFVPLPLLRPSDIARIAHERSLIAGFFNWIWLHQDGYEGRWAAFEQWILLNPV